MRVSHGPDSINLDYRIVSLLLVMATREDLLKVYLNKNTRDKNGKKLTDEDRWRPLLDLGFPVEMLRDNLYVFQDPKTQEGMALAYKAMQTMINLNDYCPIYCPSDGALGPIIEASKGAEQNLGDPGGMTI
jgi:hypothetical protein